jgi:DNA-binding NarL/FixJ family response regulator
MDVLIVSRDAGFRNRLAVSLAEDPELRIAGAVPPEETGDRIRGRSPPQVVLWDLAWGEPIQSEWRSVTRSGVPLVCLVTSADEARRARNAGASGVVSRGGSPEALAAAVHAAASGFVVLDPLLDPDWQPEATLEEDLVEPLTPREIEVLALIAEGLSNKGIAARLGIRESTVKDHVNALMGKLQAQSRTEAVILALRRGLVSV